MTSAAKPQPIVFFGSEAWAVPILQQLHQHFTVITAVTKPDAPSGRHRQLAETPVKAWAHQHSIPVLQPTKLTDIKTRLESCRPVIGVVVAYGRLIPSQIIELFPYGILNVHPSLLPRYRGPSPIENTILNADQPGFSIIRLTADMDAGDILYSKPIDAPNIQELTAPDLYTISGLTSAEIIVDCIHNVLEDKSNFKPQDHTSATFTKLIQKADGAIDWTKPSTLIERQIRAYLGWPGSFTTLLGSPVTITKAHTAPTPDALRSLHPGSPYKTESGELAIVCGQASLIIDRLKPAGKNEMTGQSFLAGHPLT